MKRIVAIALVLAVVLAALIGWRMRLQAAAPRGPAAGSGTIEGTEVRIASRVPTRIVERLVAKGDAVHAGQVLLRMDCVEPRASLAEAEARLAAARAQVTGAVAQREVASRAYAASMASAAAARDNERAVGVQRASAERERRRAEALGNALPTASLDQAVSAADALARQAAGAASSSQAVALQARASGAQVDSARVQIDVARRNVEALEATVARARVQVAECDVLAPRDAVVEDVYYEAGELPPPSATLLALVDLRELKATFYLPNAEVGRARTGAPALVEADAFPGVRFAARIVSVAAEAEFTPRNIQTRTDHDRLVYPVEVRLAASDGRLRPGMPVQVTLPGTER